MLRFAMIAMLIAWAPAPPAPQTAQCRFADGGSATLTIDRGGMALTIRRPDGVEDTATGAPGGRGPLEVNGGVASIAAARAMIEELRPQLSATPSEPQPCARATYADYFPW